jgi:predicted amidohydrolase
MNAVVGGFTQNVETLGRFRTQAGSLGADLVLSPELSLMGYPPEDLLLREGFIAASKAALDELCAATNLPPMLVGTVVARAASCLPLLRTAATSRAFWRARGPNTSRTRWSQSVNKA